MATARISSVTRLLAAGAAGIASGAFVIVPAGAAGTSSRAAIAQHYAAFQAAISAATAKAQSYSYAASAPGGAAASASEYVRQWAQYDLEVALLSADPLHPVLLRDPDPFSVPGTNPPQRSGIYSPDNMSYIAVINGSDQYTITAKRGNSADLSFQVISGFPGNGTTGTPTASLLRNQISIGPNGRYTVHVGGPAQSTNWLPTVPQTTIVTVREAFNDWPRAVPEQLSISVDGQTGSPPSTLSTTALIGALDAASNDLTVQTSYWTTLWGGLLSSLPPNVVRTPAPTQGGLAGQLSSLSHFALQPGQALVVTVGRSNAAYQGFEAADAYGQTLPTGTHPSGLNATQAQLGSDGKLHFVVAARDPGVPNWIDTEGATQGFLFLRWQGLTGALAPGDAPSGQVVALSAVRTVLPPGTPTVTPAQRASQMQARVRALGRRLQLSSNQAASVLTGYLRQLAAAVGRAPIAALYRGSSLPGSLGG